MTTGSGADDAVPGAPTRRLAPTTLRSGADDAAVRRRRRRGPAQTTLRSGADDAAVRRRRPCGPVEPAAMIAARTASRNASPENGLGGAWEGRLALDGHRFRPFRVVLQHERASNGDLPQPPTSASPQRRPAVRGLGDPHGAADRLTADPRIKLNQTSGQQRAGRRSSPAGSLYQDCPVLADVPLVGRGGGQGVGTRRADVGLPEDGPVGRRRHRPLSASPGAFLQRSPAELVPARRLCPPVVPSGRRGTRTLAGHGCRRARDVGVACCRLAQRTGCRYQRSLWPSRKHFRPPPSRKPAAGRRPITMSTN